MISQSDPLSFAAAAAELEALQCESDREPANAELHCKLGYAYLRLDRLDDASDCFTLALHFRPGMIDAHLGLGGVYKRAGRPRDALAAYRKGLELHPQSARLRTNLGLVLFELEELDAAFTECERATREASGSGEAWHNLGYVLLHLDRAEGAVSCFERALAAGARSPATATCRGHALRHLGRIAEAIEVYDEVLKSDPSFEDAIVNRGCAHLLLGRFQKGWRDYAWRFGPPGPAPRTFPFRPWRGEPLAGRSVLIYAEQGIGDEIMFASCLPDVMTLVSRCVIECNSRLAGLYARSLPAAVVRGGRKTDSQDWVRDIGTVDFQAPIGDLPRYLRPKLESFPRRCGYLVAERESVARWQSRLRELGPGPYVGFCWRGGTARTHARARSMPLSMLAPALAECPARLVSLQRGPLDIEERRALERLNAFVPEEVALEDIEDLAALIAALNLVVCIDSTVAHLAGALGRATWVLLPFCPDWRYGIRGDAMPWYPSAMLFRQHAPAAWGGVIDTLMSRFRQRGESDGSDLAAFMGVQASKRIQHS
jgi:Tfp pilus assembly protein PilF